MRLILALVSAQTFVAGLLGVLLAVMALRVLDEGDAWVGYLNAAIGIGGLMGIGAAAWLVGPQRSRTRHGRRDGAVRRTAAARRGLAGAARRARSPWP